MVVRSTLLGAWGALVVLLTVLQVPAAHSTRSTLGVWCVGQCCRCLVPVCMCVGRCVWGSVSLQNYIVTNY